MKVSVPTQDARIFDLWAANNEYKERAPEELADDMLETKMIKAEAQCE